MSVRIRSIWSGYSLLVDILQYLLILSSGNEGPDQHHILSLHTLTPTLSISVAQLDARWTGDEKVAGSIPAELATIFHGDLIMKYFFYGHSLPSADLRRAVISFWRKDVHNTRSLWGLILCLYKCGKVNWPRSIWLYWVDWAVKPPQTNKNPSYEVISVKVLRAPVKINGKGVGSQYLPGFFFTLHLP